MKKRQLGRTGLEITEISFGAWAIGSKGYGAVDAQDAHAALGTFIDAGGNFIDTARNYGNSEELIGTYLQERNIDGIFVASKTGKTQSKEDIPFIRKEAETTLRNLKREAIDLYYLHSPPADVDLMHRVLDEFEKLKEEGKVRLIGASIKGPDVTSDTVDLCKQYTDTGRIDAIQLIYSIWRQLNAESIEYAAAQGVGIVVRTALESGFLTGKYSPGHEFPEGDHRRRWGGDRLKLLLDDAADLAENAVRPPFENVAQVAIRFPLADENVSTIILGARNGDQAARNCAVDSLPYLPRDLVDELRERYADFTPQANTGS